jgi:hypothetical protein
MVQDVYGASHRVLDIFNERGCGVKSDCGGHLSQSAVALDVCTCWRLV